MGKSYRKAFMVILSITLALSLAACSFPGSNKKAEEQYDEYIDKAEDYMDDGKYKKAISAYEDAIEIFDDRDEPYIGIAMAYIELGDLDSALDILKKGKKAVEDNDDILDLIDDINDGKYDPVPIETVASLPSETSETIAAPTPTPTPAMPDMNAVNSAYLSVIAARCEDILWFQNNYGYNTQVKCASLFDITGDGIPELFFAYSEDHNNGDYLLCGQISVYTYDPVTGQAEEMITFENAYMIAAGGFRSDIVLEDNGNIVVFSDGGDEDWIYTATEYEITPDNRLSMVNTISDYSNYDYDTDSQIDEYTQNLGEIDEATFRSLYDGYLGSAVATVFISPDYELYDYSSDQIDLLNSMLGTMYYYDGLISALS